MGGLARLTLAELDKMYAREGDAATLERIECLPCYTTVDNRNDENVSALIHFDSAAFFASFREVHVGGPTFEDVFTND